MKNKFINLIDPFEAFLFVLAVAASSIAYILVG